MIKDPILEDVFGNAAILHLMELRDKIQAGQELTEDDKVWLNKYCVVMAEALKPVIAAFKELAQVVAKALKDVWEALPPETQKILTSLAAKETVGDINKEVRTNLHNLVGTPVASGTSSLPNSVINLQKPSISELQGLVPPGSRSLRTQLNEEQDSPFRRAHSPFGGFC